MRSALVVDGDVAVREIVARCLARIGCAAAFAADAAEAIATLEAAQVDVVVVDLHVALADGRRLLEVLRTLRPGLPVVTLTAEGSLRECVEAMRAGASECLIKPVHAPALETALRLLLAAVPTVPASTRVERDPCPLVGESPAMQEILRSIGRIAATDAPVLVSGETGSGKNAIARLLHELSPRARAPFVEVSCSALLAAGADFELGAAFGQAAGGTLVLDEVGDLPMQAQATLVHRLERPRAPGDPRVVALTNRDLDALRTVGRLRDDLVFRLDVMRLELPALRDRREDVVPLAFHFLGLLAARLGRPLALARETLVAMLAHTWPGNVRELENTLERMAILATGPTLGPELLPPRVRSGGGGMPPRGPGGEKRKTLN